MAKKLDERKEDFYKAFKRLFRVLIIFIINTTII